MDALTQALHEDNKHLRFDKLRLDLVFKDQSQKTIVIDPLYAQDAFKNKKYVYVSKETRDKFNILHVNYRIDVGSKWRARSFEPITGLYIVLENHVK